MNQSAIVCCLENNVLKFPRGVVKRPLQLNGT